VRDCHRLRLRTQTRRGGLGVPPDAKPEIQSDFDTPTTSHNPPGHAAANMTYGCHPQALWRSHRSLWVTHERRTTLRRFSTLGQATPTKAVAELPSLRVAPQRPSTRCHVASHAGGSPALYTRDGIAPVHPAFSRATPSQLPTAPHHARHPNARSCTGGSSLDTPTNAQPDRYRSTEPLRPPPRRSDVPRPARDSIWPSHSTKGMLTRGSYYPKVVSSVQHENTRAIPSTHSNTVFYHDCKKG